MFKCVKKRASELYLIQFDTHYKLKPKVSVCKSDKYRMRIFYITNTYKYPCLSTIKIFLQKIKRKVCKLGQFATIN